MTTDSTAESGAAPPRTFWRPSDFTAEGRARGLTLKGCDWVLAPHRPVRPGKGELPDPARKLITDADAAGLEYWGPAPGPYSWGVRGRVYHAYWAGTRKGERQSQHACGRLREYLDGELQRLTKAAFWQLSGFERLDGYREREIDRLRLALVNPVWQCSADGPTVIHAPVDTNAVEQIQLEIGA